MLPNLLRTILWFAALVLIFFKTAVLRKLFDIRFSYRHRNFSRVCLLVKMASKTVTRSIFWLSALEFKILKFLFFRCLYSNRVLLKWFYESEARWSVDFLASTKWNHFTTSWFDSDCSLFYSGTFLKFPCQMKLETSWNLSRIPMNSKEFFGINVWNFSVVGTWISQEFQEIPSFRSL